MQGLMQLNSKDFDGYSLTWNKSTFDVKSVKELMRLTEEFEDDNKN
jgi:hypothetical protein